MFLSPKEQAISDEFLERGYIIRPVADVEALTWIRSQFVSLLGNIVGRDSSQTDEDILNYIHRHVPISELNTLRLHIIHGINAIDGFREMYYRAARPYLEALVSNELAMQLRINLSIQFPGDDSSLLPVHADTWSGDSPFEVVVWLPLVDCYASKAMYLLPPNASKSLNEKFSFVELGDSELIYQKIKAEVEFLNVSYGEVLIFDQALPHGNRVNMESETRWSMNCRFKGVFTPYGDKKIGEFFEPITLRAASRNGMRYRLPEVL